MYTPDPHDTRAPVRRSPYGANPALGRHGNRARQEVLDSARRLFAEHGYHATTVEAIGEASGRSGASVYQYFASKGAIFRVLIDELSDDVLKRARELGSPPFPERGPDAWPEAEARIGRLAEVLSRHSTTFSLWAVAEQSDPALRGLAVQFMEDFAEAVRPGLENVGIAELRQRSLGIAIGSMIQWSHFTRAERAPHLGRDVLDHVLTMVLHRALAPARMVGEAPEHPPLQVDRPLGARRPADPSSVPGVRRPVTDRSRATVDKILAAATTVLSRNGFYGTSINDIATEAGVSHGSVYTYWTDRSSLFSTLAHQAAVALGDHIEAATTGFTGVEQACRWLDSWLELVCQHGAVLHIWTHEVRADPALGPLARDMQVYVAAFMDVQLRSGRDVGDLDLKAAHVVMWALLTDFPYMHHVQLGTLTRAQVLDVLSGLLIRGLFGLR
jgi:AcrR family transcriptional regulator